MCRLLLAWNGDRHTAANTHLGLCRHVVVDPGLLLLNEVVLLQLLELPAQAHVHHVVALGERRCPVRGALVLLDGASCIGVLLLQLRQPEVRLRRAGAVLVGGDLAELLDRLFQHSGFVIQLRQLIERGDILRIELDGGLEVGNAFGLAPLVEQAVGLQFGVDDLDLGVVAELLLVLLPHDAHFLLRHGLFA